MHDIIVIERPESISYDDIHNLIFLAHKTTRADGFNVKTAEMTGLEIEKHIGLDGKCFVALDDGKLVGVTAARRIERNNRFVTGKVVDQILVAVLPEYTGRHISSGLHDKVVEFAKERKIEAIELRTAYNNKKMQAACLKWGFSYIDFKSYPGLDHYTVVMLKRLSKKQPASGLNLLYRLKKVYILFRFKPGRIKRFGI